MQNWNDGKTQEYKDRKLYDIEHSTLKKVRTGVVTLHREEKRAEKGKKISYLFTTKKCPNCAIAKDVLKQANEQYVLIDAEENTDLAQKYGVMQAPTLVVVGSEDTKKYVNASNIKKYVEAK